MTLGLEDYTATELEEKALEILKGFLSAEQIETLTAKGRMSHQYFDFDAHGRHFRIYNRYWYAIRELDDEGKVIKSVCGHPARSDSRGYAVMLAHYTQIKYFGLKGYAYMRQGDAENGDGDY